MLANIQDVTSFKNHLFNNEIDEAKSLLARKQAAFKDATRAAIVTLETLPRDDLGTSLIPEDVTVKQGVPCFLTRVLVDPVCKSTPFFRGQKLFFFHFSIRIFLCFLEFSFRYQYFMKKAHKFQNEVYYYAHALRHFSKF